MKGKFLTRGFNELLDEMLSNHFIQEPIDTSRESFPLQVTTLEGMDIEGSVEILFADPSYNNRSE